MDAIEIREILEHPEDRHWTIQGFGMLRLYLDGCHIKRLHIWDPVMAVENVSPIHDHPWDFVSEIISGQMTNVLYRELRLTDPTELHDVTYKAVQIRCGEGGGPVEEPHFTRLRVRSRVVYNAGEGYSQHAEELHDSFPERGTVTVIRRTFRENNTELARVFWQGGDWVSAEPRPATPDEVDHFTRLALANWAPVYA